MISAFFLTFCTLAAISISAQEAPVEIVKKDLDYLSWNYPNIVGEGKTDIRRLSQGKKLVIAVYFAPWCPDWNSEISFLKDLREKYAEHGLEVVAIGEYDSVDSMKSHFALKKIDFPGVWETDSMSAQRDSSHYRYRSKTGDTRNWGTPWHIFLEPGKFLEKGDVLIRSAWVANGKVIKESVEPFVRKMLGLEE